MIAKCCVSVKTLLNKFRVLSLTLHLAVIIPRQGDLSSA
jgi:hypothetical protein